MMLFYFIREAIKKTKIFFMSAFLVLFNTVFMEEYEFARVDEAAYASRVGPAYEYPEEGYYMSGGSRSKSGVDNICLAALGALCVILYQQL